MPGSFRCSLCLPHLLGILALDAFFLQIPGNGVRTGNSGILLYRFLVGKIRICPVKVPLGFFCTPPGLHFLALYVLPDSTFSQLQPALRQLLTLVSSLHTYIFLFRFVNLAMDFLLQSLQGHPEGIMTQLCIGWSVHLLISKDGFRPAGGFLIYPLPHLFPLLRDVLFGGVQPVRRGVGAMNGIRQCRILQILLGKLEPGGLVLFTANVRFLLSAADMLHVSCGQVFGHRTVLGHLLDHLRPGFSLLYGCSPAFP